MDTKTPSMATARISLNYLVKNFRTSLRALNNVVHFHILILIAGIGLSLTATHYYISYKDTAVNRAFEHKALNISKTIEQNTSNSLEALSYLYAFYNSAQQFNASNFKQYTTHILQNHPEIKALEWVSKVADSERAAFEKEMQQVFAGFEIKDLKTSGKIIRSKQRDFYYPITFIAPFSGNESSLGFDLSSDQLRLDAINKAIDSRSLQATQQIQLIQDINTRKDGTIVLYPVFGNDNTLTGFLVAVYYISDIFINAINLHNNKNITVTVYDLTDDKQVTEIYTSTTNSYISLNNTSKRKNHTHIQFNKDFHVAGRKLKISILPKVGFYQHGFNFKAGVILFAGLLFSFLISAYTQLLRNKNHQLRKSNTLLNTQIDERINIVKQLHRTNQKLARINRQDTLLNIANRRHMDEYLHSEWLRSIRTGFPLSFLMADIDYFKKYNDLYGHVIGDQCLKEVASVFLQVANRPADLVARYGGEEIAIILPETFESGAYHIAEKIQEELDNLAIPHANSKVSANVTVSIGIGTISPDVTDSLPGFIQCVDEALYKAKESGRNCVHKAIIKPSEQTNIHQFTK
ncbi:MAG: diguanylate cyclase [Gammaproteobacteria bacterium]|nr:diguanylate cyclase [Gammaproteobacteria bacterium]